MLLLEHFHVVLEVPIHSILLIGLCYMEKFNKHWLKVLDFPEALEDSSVIVPGKIKNYFLSTPMAFLPYLSIPK